MGTSTRYRDDHVPPAIGAGAPAADPAPDPVRDLPPPIPPNAELIAAIHDVQVSLNLVMEKIAELITVMKQRGNAEQH